jgi:hypothetical protein
VCCQAAADFLEVAEALTNERLDGAATTALTKEKLEAAALTDEKPSAEPQAAALTDVPPFAVLGLVRVLASHAFERPHCHIMCHEGRRAACHLLHCVRRFFINPFRNRGYGEISFEGLVQPGQLTW